ncbi:hypothetical protein TNCV_3045661 [Trichonephila clavipes]|uniref:Uncharacterized protein n=1 Tax=Trichonephila clavipes TaxID=2585209 RepID=A0A8X6V6H8_TRICX|nr:hypothetical protein TNCV_3045661 [Trichonephila clavipes]
MTVYACERNSKFPIHVCWSLTNERTFSTKKVLAEAKCFQWDNGIDIEKSTSWIVVSLANFSALSLPRFLLWPQTDMTVKKLTQDFASSTEKTISKPTVYIGLAKKALYARRSVVCASLKTHHRKELVLYGAKKMSLGESGAVYF